MRGDSFRDQVAIVTGASAGIGRALALRLAGEGARVALAARRADRLEQVAAECRQRGGEALVVPTDVAAEEQCQALVEQTITAFGRLDMLVNNAGFSVSALFEDLPDLRLFQQVMAVNFSGAVSCTYYALPHLRQSHGRLVVVSSMGGKVAIPRNAAYSASKFALQGFYDSLRIEVARHGVSITAIHPYWVISEFHEAQLDKHGAPHGARGRAFYNARMMTADRCAAVVLAAARRRRREALMGPGALAVWLKALAPGLVDWLAVKAFLEPAIRRARAAAARQAAASSMAPDETAAEGARRQRE